MARGPIDRKPGSSRPDPLDAAGITCVDYNTSTCCGGSSPAAAGSAVVASPA
jgi:hypothetical protein